LFIDDGHGEKNADIRIKEPVDPSELVATVAAVAGRVSQSGEGAAR